MHKYKVRYDIDGQVFRDGKPEPGTDCELSLFARNKKEARQKFNELYYILWQRSPRAHNIRIEREEIK